MSYQQVPQSKLNPTPTVNNEQPRRRRRLLILLLLLLLLLALLFALFQFFANSNRGGQAGTSLAPAQTATASAQGGASASAALTATAAANSQGAANSSTTATAGSQGGSSLPVPAFNNVGARDDNNATQADYDGRGDSYSTEALQSAKIVAGQAISVNGVSFNWPNAVAGKEDNYQANGQVIPVSPVKGATIVAFLGAASNGPSVGKGTITYTDGTMQKFDLSFTDWTTRAGKSSISFSNRVAVTMPYRNKAGKKEMVNTYLFSSEIALQPGKTIRSVTLPSSTDQGQLHVFAVSTR